ncbi:MAG: hypothetical protein KDD50_03195 [Bdellovibrionales bacterium]|nr:hypothetical protein [Bdellovibrionales bacterium]
MKHVYILLILCFHLTSFAAGVIKISGQIYGFSAETLMVKSKSNIFYIKKSSLSPDLLKSLKKIKVNQKIDLTVAFDGITEVKPAKRAK